MAVFKFRLNPADLGTWRPELKRAYVTGQDRTPGRVAVVLKPGMLTVSRPSPESGRFHVPWLVEGFGTPVIATATLAERAAPYDLGVELARGRLNDVRNQAADWSMLGLKIPVGLDALIAEAQRAFARAATSRDDPAAAQEGADRCLVAACRAGEELAASYTEQVIKKRLEHAPKLPTHLGIALDGNPKAQAWSTPILEGINAARVRCPWGAVAADEGQFRWEETDLQLHWARKRKLIPTIGPLLDLRPAALPDWLWLWEGDYEEIQTQAADFVRQAITRYKGKVAGWHLIHRVASAEILGLSEEEQVRLTARLIQVARQVDPQVPLIVDFDRPWAEWLASSPYQLGPLHLADSLARADLGLTGIGLEIAPGYGPAGSLMRDLFEFSRLLDLFALVNLPLHLSFAFPSAGGPDPRATEPGQVDPMQWPGPPSAAQQAQRARRWMSLAAAKPFVRSITWLQPTDALPHLFGHAGLFGLDGKPKPAFEALKGIKAAYLGG